ncbi:MAG: haloalkane dehalogenase [Actinomycetota bacterium]|nr:haloalkane dehalogenase [Actinomycetota bacterium]
MNVYRTPGERFANLPGYPFEPHYVDQDGLRMHYVDEGEGRPVLLLHGEPTWSYLYRKVIPPLRRVGRVVAPDYLGFGRSDKPVARDWYTFDRHVESIERLIDELDLRDATVVVQDWGGPIGCRVAVSRPDRVSRLVILNTGLYSGRPPSDEWLRFREFVRRVGTELRPGQLVRVTCVTELPDEVVAAYDAPYPTPESLTGPVMFPELVPTEPEHPSAAAMLKVREAMSRWEGRALVFFSDSDPIFSPRVAERIAELLPNAELQPPVEGAGHFLQEDKGQEVGERIAAWLQTSESV